MNHIGSTCLVIVPWWALRSSKEALQVRDSVLVVVMLHFFHLRGLDHLKSDLDLFDFELTDDEMKQLNDYSPSTALMVWPSPPTSGKQRPEMACREIRFMKSKRHGDSGICSWNMNERELVVNLFDISVIHLKDKAGWSKISACWPDGMISWFPSSKTRLDSDEKNESVVVACLELHSRMQWLSRLHRQWHDVELSCIPNFQSGSKWFKFIYL